MATLNAKERKHAGKRYAKAVRNEGAVPAVIYGQKKGPVTISLDPVEYVKRLNNSEFKKNLIIDLALENGNVERVITKEINVDPINNRFIHIDFLRVSEKSPIQIDVPIRVVGISAGQRLGGVLVKPKASVRMECLPDEIPVDVEVNVTNLTIGENFRTEELTLKGSQKIVSNPRDILVKVESTKVSKVAQAQEGAADVSEGSASDSAN
jgi:large subunit ribosomal protein L25